MSKPLMVCPDPERPTVDYLTEQLAARDDLTPVGVGVPPGWTLASDDFVQVELDGTPTATPPLWVATMRVTCWSSSRTRAKNRAALCEGLLLRHPGDRAVGIAGCRPGTGILVTQDPDTRGQLASVTVRMRLRGNAA